VFIASGVAQCDIYFAGALAQARQVYATRPFTLARVDIELPDGGGIDFIEWLHRHDTETSAMVVSTFAAQDLIPAALKAGATGYVLKERDDDELIAALRASSTAARRSIRSSPRISCGCSRSSRWQSQYSRFRWRQAKQPPLR